MYCIRCGVELPAGAERCPLCSLRVYHPELEETPEPAPYPRRAEAEIVSHGGLLFLLSFLFAIPVLICLLIDRNMNGAVTWSGYTAFGILALYGIVCLPLWFRKPNPVIFFPLDMAALLGVSLYVCLKTGGRWFLPFAFPTGGALLLILEAVLVLLRYTVGKKRFRALFILGGGFLACGGLCMLIEFLLHITFSLPMQWSFGIPMLWWSLYPLAVLGLLGLMLIIIGLCPPLRISLHKKFFL